MSPPKARSTAALTGALLAALTLAGCGSDAGSETKPPPRIPASQAESAVTAQVTALYQAAGLTPATPVAAHVAACDANQQNSKDYSVGAVVKFTMSSADDAKQAITKVHDYMGAHGFTQVSTTMNDSTYLVTGSIDGQTWGVDYYPKAGQDLRFQGGTGCNVQAETSATTAPRPSST